MKVHALPAEEVFRRLFTREGGLSREDAERRLREYGTNEIRQVRRTPLLRKLLAQVTNFLAILLWIAAALCFVSEAVHPGEGMTSLGAAIVAVILVNAAFTFIQEYRAERAVEALRRLLPFRVKVLREGARADVPAAEVVPGDLILLEEGDKVPADARVVEAGRLMVNNASLTGESDAKPRSPDAWEGEYLESPNIVFAGTHVVGGSGKAVAFATGMATEFGRIAHLAGAVEPGLSPLQKEIAKATRIVAAVAAATGTLFFALGMLTGRGFWHNFIFAIGIIIANVPEGLLPTVTLALAMGSQRMARKKALVKTLSAVETLGSVTVICTDKTGTLTENRMEARAAWLPGEGLLPLAPPGAGEERWPVTGAGRAFLTVAALCHNAAFDGERYRGDPTETALLAAAVGRIGHVAAERVREIPFDAERKRMTVVSRVGAEMLVLTKGAPEAVIPRCTRVLSGSGEQPLDEARGREAAAAYQTMAGEGLRVIAFAMKRSGLPETPGPPGPAAVSDGGDEAIEGDLALAGLIGLADPVRPEVPGAVRTCRAAGIKVIMITGDGGRTAAAVARQAGIADAEPPVVEGREMDGMSDGDLRDRIAGGESVFARVTPRHKMRIVSVLKDEGERVAVTGDGVNDAPALKKADIGIAMGIAGTDVAREAADIVLLDDNFATIVIAVEEGRTIFENIRKFITYIFAHLTPEAVPYILFALFKVPLPLTVMQILAIDLGTETIPALALGVEPPEGLRLVGSRPGASPHPGTEPRRLIDAPLLLRSYLFLGLIGSVGVLAGYFFVLFRGGWRWGMVLPAGHILERQAATATFLGIVIAQVGNVFACRSSRTSVFALGLLSNRLVLAGIAVEIAMTLFIVYHPWGQAVFGTAPLPLDVWLLLLPFSALLLGADEARKLLARRTARRR